MSETLYAEDYLNYQTNRSWLRKTIRKIYLWQVRRHVIGNAIDFGCGVGEHLTTFSKNSLGLEINEATVKYCQHNGLNVQLYRPDEDNYELKNIPAGKYQTLVISHVLEHLLNPDEMLKKLAGSCQRIGVKRIFITVPCEVGFAHDKTHVTFINKKFIKENGLENFAGYKKMKWGYFPFNFQFVGKLFVYNEFYVVYDLA
jgi:hypothetical protein